MPDFDIPEPHFVAEHLEVARTLLCFFLHDETKQALVAPRRDGAAPRPRRIVGKRSILNAVSDQSKPFRFRCRITAENYA
jgi:hypothetical protein